MELEMISPPQEVENGFEMFKLTEKTPELIRSLDERYREIADILRRPKYEELLETYKENLLSTSSIIYF
jgi:preprotein translocase subunit Sss1